MEARFTGETDPQCCEGREPQSQRSAEKGAHKEMNKENVSPKTLTWKMKGVEFHELLQSICNID